MLQSITVVNVIEGDLWVAPSVRKSKFHTNTFTNSIDSLSKKFIYQHYLYINTILSMKNSFKKNVIITTYLCRKYVVRIWRFKDCVILCGTINFFAHYVKGTRFIQGEWLVWWKSIHPAYAGVKEIWGDVEVVVPSAYLQYITFGPKNTILKSILSAKEFFY